MLPSRQALRRFPQRIPPQPTCTSPPGREVTGLANPQSRILRPRRSPVTCMSCGLQSAQPRVVRDYLERRLDPDHPRVVAALRGVERHLLARLRHQSEPALVPRSVMPYARRSFAPMPPPLPVSTGQAPSPPSPRAEPHDGWDRCAGSPCRPHTRSNPRRSTSATWRPASSDSRSPASYLVVGVGLTVPCGRCCRCDGP
jgi:hypothetical protein